MKPNRRDILKLLGLSPIFPSLMMMQEQEEKFVPIKTNLASKFQPMPHQLECRVIPPGIASAEDGWKTIMGEMYRTLEIPGTFEVVATYREPFTPSPPENDWWTEAEYTWRMFFGHSKLLEVKTCAAWLEYPDNLVEWCENLTMGPHIRGILNHATAEEWPHESVVDKRYEGGPDKWWTEVPVCVLCNGKIRLKLEGGNFRSFKWPEEGIQIKTAGKNTEPCKRT